MRIRLLAVGQKMPDWVTTAYLDYAKRLNDDVRLELIEIPAAKRSKNSEVDKMKQQEGEALLAAIHHNERVIALEVGGKEYSTHQLSQQMDNWLQGGQNVCLLVGGPDGLSSDVIKRADGLWSLSPLTLPHPLVRVIVAEQLYRAWTLLKGHPYHR
ncbi:MAG TPA: 23S rRNA (pseudouridine(1915)-N(3))-methyltransferase RlmH [Agitococcus sp.]|uniref:23S rRNA (pseudouridine(1915)-N(3))-methyltransferase RlmH n=1 Tax=uncultured Agitococcus sp. TaxID=1506599 RepID=UPI00262ABF0B|nr:23S rRNA (pseudouridine(1915)-N(3))-methyltransferase RlmH [uncultured Agitococcus sp.]HMV60023.1 23S rRNA (pseudouridine(1915)-N(3))-methyltransferase RlmH [Agitococcus sp.]HNA20729.1 23S rRNA (pseudouridine(1915)-N(3))-methyltransferase RlmH [Agitococcus sp.]HNC86636.1 23S rRNA (pseudouridine(1915)-N(3))-methyltransferase RlmH [Agitococcus sp.]HNH43700.1 23S rRNA (pseudouridine(1915)-N(3))-methyltransferase RlmH [Agitococcus sp.]HNL36184.1 23S rRNA (pseudouridine(1915)-N(3))-methyltransfe